MRKFTFRLQRLLDYRRMQEKWAKDEFLDARARRLEAEEERNRIADLRESMVQSCSQDLASRIAMETTVNRLDDNERAQDAVVGVLIDEETQARDIWLKVRQDAEVIDKLRETRKEDWQVEANRSEQNELDDWSSSRSQAS